MKLISNNPRPRMDGPLLPPAGVQVVLLVIVAMCIAGMVLLSVMTPPEGKIADEKGVMLTL